MRDAAQVELVRIRRIGPDLLVEAKLAGGTLQGRVVTRSGRRFGVKAKGLPADASGAHRPNPQATTKLGPRPSSRKGYVQIEELRELGIKEGFCKSHLFRQSGAGAGIQNRLKILDSGSRRACPE